MSMHRIPLTPVEEEGFHAHGLQRSIGKPSQLADVFRQGVAWGIKAERKATAEKREALVSAWMDIPEDLRCHPALEKLYQELKSS